MPDHSIETANGDRFEFGKNWKSFLRVVDEERVREAEKSLQRTLGDLQGLKFLDAGCGSGLFSLAARRLGARVHSFDYDPSSVACTRELKARYFPQDSDWTIDEASVLDRAYLARLGTFDIVYSWGVLHHTGRMWQAIANVAELTAPDGRLLISIYNHQAYWTRLQTPMKRTYNKLPLAGQWLMAGAFIAFQCSKGCIMDLCLARNPVTRYRVRKRTRGMSMLHDWIDWLGGYPFEVAKPEEVFDFCTQRGYSLQKLRTAGSGHGCNEFIFLKLPDAPRQSARPQWEEQAA